MRGPLAQAPRSADFGGLQETFLVAGVATVLVIRTQLWLTNYPQLGGAGLHIAHLLYGGILMTVAIGVAITYLGAAARRVVAIVGGIGFGFFIDELGKFVTADNDYFFQPASALIYLTFVGIFLLSRSMRRRGELSDWERRANAIEAAGTSDGAPARAPSGAVRLAARARATSLRLAEQRWFPALVAAAFAVWAAGSVIVVFELVLSLALHLGGARHGYVSDAIGDLSVLNIASLASSVVSAALVAVGLLRLWRGDRAGGYRLLDRALLVSIFVTRVFVFVESQFGAVFGLAIDVLLLIAVRYLAAQERRRAPARDVTVA